MPFIKEPLPEEELIRPSNHNVPWFKISNWMSESYSSCRESVVWQFIHRVKKRKGDSGFLKRNCVVFAISQQFRTNYSIGENVNYFLTSEAKQHLGNIDWIKFVEECAISGVDPIKTGVQIGWEFPSPAQKWKYHTWDDFIKQCLSLGGMVIDFCDKLDIQPMFKDVPAVLRTLGAPLEIDGEILDETDGKPTIHRAQLNFIAQNGELYIWKVSNKKAGEREKIALISETVYNQAIVARFNYNLNFPITVNVVRAVVSKTGEKTALQVDTTHVYKNDLDEQKRKLAIKAKDIKAMRLFKERSFRCPMCDYYDICILGKRDEFVKEVWEDSLDDKATKFDKYDDDDDGMPF
jgi:hypothetical protein